jgi:hypothetical protein
MSSLECYWIPFSIHFGWEIKKKKNLHATFLSQGCLLTIVALLSSGQDSQVEDYEK